MSFTRFLGSELRHAHLFESHAAVRFFGSEHVFACRSNASQEVGSPYDASLEANGGGGMSCKMLLRK